nr:hypothetical protein [Tanacetum cinerariifolium]
MWNLIGKWVHRLNVVMFLEQLLCTYLFSIVTDYLPWLILTLDIAQAALSVTSLSCGKE